MVHHHSFRCGCALLDDRLLCCAVHTKVVLSKRRICLNHPCGQEAVYGRKKVYCSRRCSNNHKCRQQYLRRKLAAGQQEEK